MVTVAMVLVCGWAQPAPATDEVDRCAHTVTCGSLAEHALYAAQARGRFLVNTLPSMMKALQLLRSQSVI